MSTRLNQSFQIEFRLSQSIYQDWPALVIECLIPMICCIYSPPRGMNRFASKIGVQFSSLTDSRAISVFRLRPEVLFESSMHAYSCMQIGLREMHRTQCILLQRIISKLKPLIYFRKLLIVLENFFIWLHSGKHINN